MGRHYSADEALQFWLDGHAESLSDGACGGAGITPKLQETWDNFGEAVEKSLYRHLPNAKVEEIYDSEGEESVKSDVYATLTGQGSGIWDGRWDGYLTGPQLKKVQKGLKKDLGGDRGWASDAGSGKLEYAFHDAVYEWCGDEFEENPRRRKKKRGKKKNPYMGDAVQLAKQRKYGYPKPPPKPKKVKNPSKPKKRVSSVRALVAKALK